MYLYYNSNISSKDLSYGIQTLNDVRLIHVFLYAQACFDDLDLDTGVTVGRQSKTNIQRRIISTTEQAMSIILATTVSHILLINVLMCMCACKQAFLRCVYHQKGVGSVGRSSDSRSKDPRFEPRVCQEHKKKVVRVFPSKICCADSLSVCPTPV